jgi:hypothetical protein
VGKNTSKVNILSKEELPWQKLGYSRQNQSFIDWKVNDKSYYEYLTRQIYEKVKLKLEEKIQELKVEGLEFKNAVSYFASSEYAEKIRGEKKPFNMIWCIARELIYYRPEDDCPGFFDYDVNGEWKNIFRFGKKGTYFLCSWNRETVDVAAEAGAIDEEGGQYEHVALIKVMAKLFCSQKNRKFRWFKEGNAITYYKALDVSINDSNLTIVPAKEQSVFGIDTSKETWGDGCDLMVLIELLKHELIHCLLGIKDRTMDASEERHETLPSDETHNKYFVELTHRLFGHRNIQVRTDTCKGDNTHVKSNS